MVIIHGHKILSQATLDVLKYGLITGMVSTSPGSGLLRTACPLVQYSPLLLIYCPQTVEVGIYYTSSKDRRAARTCRVPAHLDHSCLEQGTGACNCPRIHLSSILEPPAPLNFTDQYAFRPTGSTTAALIAILQSVTEMMSCISSR